MDGTQGLSLTLCVEATYKDECVELRAAVCKAAGLPADQAEQALKQLSKEEPKKLQALLRAHGHFTDQLIASELESLGVRLEALEATVGNVVAVMGDVAVCVEGVAAGVQQVMQLLERRDAEDGRIRGLSKYLDDLWSKCAGGRLKRSVPSRDFMCKVTKWFKENG